MRSKRAPATGASRSPRSARTGTPFRRPFSQAFSCARRETSTVVRRPRAARAAATPAKAGPAHSLVVAVHDLRRAAHHDPVLAAPAVHLQAQARAGLDLDALDLESRALLDHRIRAPRAVHGAMEAVRLVALRLEARVDVAHFL